MSEWTAEPLDVDEDVPLVLDEEVPDEEVVAFLDRPVKP